MEVVGECVRRRSVAIVVIVGGKPDLETRM